MADDSNAALARRLLLQQLESLQRAGVMQISRLAATIADSDVSVVSLQEEQPAPRMETKTAAGGGRKASAAVALASGSAVVTQSYPTDLPDSPAERQRLLDELDATQVRGCPLCKELACSRKQTVFGVGNPAADIVFFGEAPGADEDRLGEPFVGRAGQLLTKIIEVCTWKRADVYIMNVLKCRPPENRNPLPHEVANCRPFFERQLEIIRPRYIVCVGTVPSQALLQTADTVGKLRGRFHQYRDSKVLVTYHPSYLLRNPAAKKYVWEDMQILLKDMGITLPPRSA